MKLKIPPEYFQWQLGEKYLWHCAKCYQRVDYHAAAGPIFISKEWHAPSLWIAKKVGEGRERLKSAETNYVRRYEVIVFLQAGSGFFCSPCCLTNFMTTVFSFIAPFTEKKVHRNLYWLASAWGIISVRERPGNSCQYCYDKQFSNATVPWHFYYTQIWGFLLRRITGLVRLEGPLEFIWPSLWLGAESDVRWGESRFSVELHQVLSWKLYTRKGLTFSPFPSYKSRSRC